MRAFSILFAVVFAWSAAALAQPVPPTCDPNVKSAIDARAWMGGTRDMESAQTLITRTSSVLDLSCFDRHIANFALQNNVLFSDGHQRFSPVTAGSASLFRAPPFCYGPRAPGLCPCTALVGCYLIPQPPDRLFPNPPWPLPDEPGPVSVPPPIPLNPPMFFPVIPGPNPPGGLYTNLSLDTAFISLIRLSLRSHLIANFQAIAPPPPATVCGNMMVAWSLAKCTNFDRNGFLTFDQHRIVDRRLCPLPRTAWNINFTNAYPPPRPRSPAPPAFPPGGLDQTLTYRGQIYPTNCSAVDPLPTGLMVDLINTPFPDAVCPGVGCYYDPAGGGNCRN